MQWSSGSRHPLGKPTHPLGSGPTGAWGQPEPPPTASSSLRRCLAEDWSAERPFTGFQLGDVLNIQAEVGTESHVPLRLFVDSCVAALSPGTDSSPHYAIIDFNG